MKKQAKEPPSASPSAKVNKVPSCSSSRSNCSTRNKKQDNALESSRSRGPDSHSNNNCKKNSNSSGSRTTCNQAGNNCKQHPPIQYNCSSNNFSNPGSTKIASLLGRHGVPSNQQGGRVTNKNSSCDLVTQASTKSKTFKYPARTKATSKVYSQCSKSELCDSKSTYVGDECSPPCQGAQQQPTTILRGASSQFNKPGCTTNNCRIFSNPQQQPRSYNRNINNNCNNNSSFFPRRSCAGPKSPCCDKCSMPSAHSPGCIAIRCEPPERDNASVPEDLCYDLQELLSRTCGMDNSFPSGKSWVKPPPRRSLRCTKPSSKPCFQVLCPIRTPNGIQLVPLALNSGRREEICECINTLKSAGIPVGVGGGGGGGFPSPFELTPGGGGVGGQEQDCFPSPQQQCYPGAMANPAAAGNLQRCNPQEYSMGQMEETQPHPATSPKGCLKPSSRSENSSTCEQYTLQCKILPRKPLSSSSRGGQSNNNNNHSCFPRELTCDSDPEDQCPDVDLQCSDKTKASRDDSCSRRGYSPKRDRAITSGRSIKQGDSSLTGVDVEWEGLITTATSEPPQKKVCSSTSMMRIVISSNKGSAEPRQECLQKPGKMTSGENPENQWQGAACSSQKQQQQQPQSPLQSAVNPFSQSQSLSGANNNPYFQAQGLYYSQQSQQQSQGISTGYVYSELSSQQYPASNNDPYSQQQCPPVANPFSQPNCPPSSNNPYSQPQPQQQQCPPSINNNGYCEPPPRCQNTELQPRCPPPPYSNAVYYTSGPQSSQCPCPSSELQSQCQASVNNNYCSSSRPQSQCPNTEPRFPASINPYSHPQQQSQCPQSMSPYSQQPQQQQCPPPPPPPQQYRDSNDNKNYAKVFMGLQQSVNLGPHQQQQDQAENTWTAVTMPPTVTNNMSLGSTGQYFRPSVPQQQQCQQQLLPASQLQNQMMSSYGRSTCRNTGNGSDIGHQCPSTTYFGGFLQSVVNIVQGPAPQPPPPREQEADIQPKLSVVLHLPDSHVYLPNDYDSDDLPPVVNIPGYPPEADKHNFPQQQRNSHPNERGGSAGRGQRGSLQHSNPHQRPGGGGGGGQQRQSLPQHFQPNNSGGSQRNSLQQPSPPQPNQGGPKRNSLQHPQQPNQGGTQQHQAQGHPNQHPNAGGQGRLSHPLQHPNPTHPNEGGQQQNRRNSGGNTNNTQPALYSQQHQQQHPNNGQEHQEGERHYYPGRQQQHQSQGTHNSHGGFEAQPQGAHQQPSSAPPPKIEHPPPPLQPKSGDSGTVVTRIINRVHIAHSSDLIRSLFVHTKEQSKNPPPQEVEYQPDPYAFNSKIKVLFPHIHSCPTIHRTLSLGSTVVSEGNFWGTEKEEEKAEKSGPEGEGLFEDLQNRSKCPFPYLHNPGGLLGRRKKEYVILPAFNDNTNSNAPSQNPFNSAAPEQEQEKQDKLLELPISITIPSQVFGGSKNTLKRVQVKDDTAPGTSAVNVNILDPEIHAHYRQNVKYHEKPPEAPPAPPPPPPWPPDPPPPPLKPPCPPDIPPPTPDLPSKCGQQCQFQPTAAAPQSCCCCPAPTPPPRCPRKQAQGKCCSVPPQAPAPACNPGWDTRQAFGKNSAQCPPQCSPSAPKSLPPGCMPCPCPPENCPKERGKCQKSRWRSNRSVKSWRRKSCCLSSPCPPAPQQELLCLPAQPSCAVDKGILKKAVECNAGGAGAAINPCRECKLVAIQGFQKCVPGLCEQEVTLGFNPFAKNNDLFECQLLPDFLPVHEIFDCGSAGPPPPAVVNNNGPLRSSGSKTRLQLAKGGKTSKELYSTGKSNNSGPRKSPSGVQLDPNRNDRNGNGGTSNSTVSSQLPKCTTRSSCPQRGLYAPPKSKSGAGKNRTGNNSNKCSPSNLKLTGNRGALGGSCNDKKGRAQGRQQQQDLGSSNGNLRAKMMEQSPSECNLHKGGGKSNKKYTQGARRHKNQLCTDSDTGSRTALSPAFRAQITCRAVCLPHMSPENYCPK